MLFNTENLPILILLSIPLQYNFITDSMDRLIEALTREWIYKKEFTYYETYFSRKMAFYTGMVSSISFIFVFYRIKKLRLIISIIFFLGGFTWLLYFAVKEDKIIIIYIIRGIQGIYLGTLHMSHFPYVMRFANEDKKCFFGCLNQFSMFFGLFIMNLLFAFVNWKTIIVLLCTQSIIFGGLIWFVPEMHIKPKSILNESIFSKENIGPLLIMIILMNLQHFTGIGIFLNQISTLLSGIGINMNLPFQTCLFDFVGALATLIAAFITDAVGSKIMWAISSFGIFVGLTLYAITLKINLANWISTLGVFIYFLFYGLGLGPIAWYLSSTMFPDGVRIESTAINACVNLALPQILDVVWENLDKYEGQFGSIAFCSVVSFLSIFFGLIFIPREIHYNEENANIF